MKKYSDKETSKYQTEIKTFAQQQNISHEEAYGIIEQDLNAKIRDITNTINNDYPELEKYLDEMPLTIPNEDDPQLTLDRLNDYYESLYSLVVKYKEDHSDPS